MQSKFRNIRVEVDGIKFDSKREARRYGDLKLLQMGKVISDLECQPKIPLMVNGKKIGHYIGDFRYVENGQTIIEDVKSQITKTPIYRLKKKILETYDPPILIRETF